jgi:AmmeMemoRadiSam system radical SAM enzyme
MTEPIGVTDNKSSDWKKLPDGSVVGSWWQASFKPGRIDCRLCPRECSLAEGDRGFCFVRENRNQEIVLSTYGRSTGFCIDPIEKKPLNHFYPGSAVLSFGTAGCNLGCQFCQNWDISKSREISRLSESAQPAQIAIAAKSTGCTSVAFTYNDPVIWAEYAIDTARECRQLGIKAVAVTAGYISAESRGDFFRWMDAANIDLKAFTEEFYRKVTYSHLQPVLDTLRYVARETSVWLELTNLIIPDLNDSSDDLRRMCDWIVQELGEAVPIHFTAFHPDFRMNDRGRTDPETLFAAFEIARQAGLRYPYVGNLLDRARQSTYCPNCSALVIERRGYEIGQYRLVPGAIQEEARCSVCGTSVPGRYAAAPIAEGSGCIQAVSGVGGVFGAGSLSGTWGAQRQPIRISDFNLSPSRK